MKKIFVITILFYGFLIKSSAQTKEETESWIIEKINKYLAVMTIDYEYTWPDNSVSENKLIFFPENIDIRDGKIIVEYTYKQTDNKRDDEIITNTHHKIFADIYSINNIFSDRYVSDNTHSYSGNTDFLSINLNCFCSSEKSRNITILITGNEEVNLKSRLQAAFTKLKTYYLPPKDTF